MIDTKARISDLKALIGDYTYMQTLTSADTATEISLREKLIELKAEYKELTGKDFLI